MKGKNKSSFDDEIRMYQNTSKYDYIENDNNINTSFSSYNCDDEINKIKNKSKKRNRNILILTLVGAFIILSIIAASIVIFSVDDEYEKGIYSNGNYFEISIEDFITIMDLKNEIEYDGSFNNIDIPYIDEMDYNESDDVYERTFDLYNQFLFKIYPTEDYNIKKIVISYNNKKSSSNETYFKFYTYTNLVYQTLWGEYNYDDNDNQTMWNKLLENNDVIDGRFSFSSAGTYTDKKAKYDLKVKDDGTTIVTITPN